MLLFKRLSRPVCLPFMSLDQTLKLLATLNWPTHRGSATACPLAAFGLSAFFYTVIAGFAFPGDTSSLLMFLSLATSLLVLVAIPFLIVVDHRSGTGYTVLPTNERGRRDSNVLHRSKTHGSRYKASAVPQPETSKHHLIFYTLTPPGQLPTASSRRRRTEWSLHRDIVPVIWPWRHR